LGNVALEHLGVSREATTSPNPNLRQKNTKET
jgi:hypothetical protein